jgi:hypothetical protein
MNVETGAEAAQFPEKEYINGIAFAVHTTSSGALSINIHIRIWGQGFEGDSALVAAKSV